MSLFVSFSINGLKENVIPPPWYKRGRVAGGGGGGGLAPPPPPPPPPIEFLIGCSVSKRFYLQWEEVYFMGGDNAGGL